MQQGSSIQHPATWETQNRQIFSILSFHNNCSDRYRPCNTYITPTSNYIENIFRRLKKKLENCLSRRNLIYCQEVIFKSTYRQLIRCLSLNENKTRAGDHHSRGWVTLKLFFTLHIIYSFFFLVIPVSLSLSMSEMILTRLYVLVSPAQHSHVRRQCRYW